LIPIPDKSGIGGFILRDAVLRTAPQDVVTGWPQLWNARHAQTRLAKARTIA